MSTRYPDSRRVIIITGDSELDAVFEEFQRLTSTSSRPRTDSTDTGCVDVAALEPGFVNSVEAAIEILENSRDSNHSFEVAVVDSSWLGKSAADVCRKLWLAAPRLGIVYCGNGEPVDEVSRLFATAPRPGSFVVLREPFSTIELVDQIQRHLERNSLEARCMQYAEDVKRLTRCLDRVEAESQSQRRQLKRLRLERLEPSGLNRVAGFSPELHEVLFGDGRFPGPAVRRLTTEPVDGLIDKNVAPASEPAVDSARQNSRIAGRILVAEDVPMNLKLLTFLLENAGGEVVGVNDGETALSAYDDSVRGGHPFELILLDVVMPGVDGYECCRELRRRGFTGPIVAVTARTAALDRQQCHRAGYDECLSKPIDRNLLIETAQRLMSGSQKPQEQRLLDRINASMPTVRERSEADGREGRDGHDGRVTRLSRAIGDARETGKD